MNTFKFIALATIAILFASCKATQPTGPPSGATPMLVEATQILDTTESQFLLFADSTNGNPWQAIMLTANWVQTMPNVQSAQAIDSTYVEIVLNSGLTTAFSFTQADDSGFCMFRGGHGHDAGGGAEAVDAFHSTNTITNPNVLIYAAAYSQFYTGPDMQQVVNYFTNSGLGLTVTLLKDQQCTPQLVQTFQNYGLVIMDTHGESDAFLSGTVVTVPRGLKSESSLKTIMESGVGVGSYANFTSGQFVLEKNFIANPYKLMWQKTAQLVGVNQVWVSTKYLQALPSMPNTVVFGNMCYSGQSTPVTYNSNIPMQTAFSGKNLIAYYGFAFANGQSTVVSDPFAHLMEDTLVRALVTVGDSTGSAGLPYNGGTFFETYNGNELYFKQYNSANYSYMKCGDTLVDTRDGQKYPTVCIGNQKWMAKNLNYNAPGSVVYNNDPANGPIYGRLYDWPTVMQGAPASNATPSGVQGVCPKGWHVPSAPEYAALSTALGGDAVAGGAMKSTSSLWVSPNTGATNSSGFSALAGGTYIPSDTIFEYLGTSATFWNTYEDSTLFYGGVRLLQNTWSNTVPGVSITTSLTSCRCVKDP